MNSNEGDLQILLRKLSKEKAIAFGLSCAERLLPNYRRFSEIEKWGEYARLEKIIDILWEYTLGKKTLPNQMENLINECDILTPDTDDFSSINTSFAIDTCSSIIEILDYIIDEDIAHIFNVSRITRDTIDMYIQERDCLEDAIGKSISEYVNSDFLMQRELEKQLKDVKVLERQDILKKEFVSEFRSLVQGKSNIL